MKKKLLILMLVISALVCVFASCGECKHESYEVKSEVAATCVVEGKRISACTECGLEKVESIPKSGDHTLKTEETEPTCLAPGMVISVCTVEGCDFKTETVSKPKLEKCNMEDYKEVIRKPATCTENGQMVLVCTVCGDDDGWYYGFNPEIPAIKHTYERKDIGLTDEDKGISFVAGNCQIEGYISRICKDCGTNGHITREEYKKLETSDPDNYDPLKWAEMEKKKHVYNELKDKVVEPTCTEPGYDIWICTVEGCGYENKVVNAFATGHNYNTDSTAVEGTDYIDIAKATCINPGFRAYICTECKEQATEGKGYVEIPATGVHNVVKGENLDYSMEATCTEKAYSVYRCKADPSCTYTETFETGEPKGHSEYLAKEPCCLTQGREYYKCHNCDFERYSENAIDIKHVQGEKVADRTCVLNTMYKCSECSTVYPAYSVADGGNAEDQAHGIHKWTVLESIVGATCYSEGYSVYSCEYACGYIYGDNKSNDEKEEYVDETDMEVEPRVDHIFNAITSDGRAVCIAEGCGAQYRDISTEVTTGSEKLCLGGCDGECSCGLTVEWNGYITPKEPEKITANVVFVKDKLTWASVTPEDNALVMGEGIISLKGTDETVYEITLYSSVDGAAIGTITVDKGTEYVLVDLYKYETVAKIEIKATTDAEVSLFTPVK